MRRARRRRIDLGGLKIGYTGQPKGWTRSKIPETFVSLPVDWFSLGQDVGYYRTFFQELSPDERIAILRALRDVVIDESTLVAAREEQVFKDSLMRGVSLSTIHGQFKRVLQGEVELTDFHFSYFQAGDEKHAPMALDFEVKASSKPSTNVHVLIGRNGVGKTTLLNNMVGALLDVPRMDQPAHGFNEPSIFRSTPLSKEYFSSVVSVSFSAFDPFLPPADRPDRTLGPAYFYIGMKNARSGQAAGQRPPPKTDSDLVNDFIASFRSCLSQSVKRARWLAAIERLESDANFAEMDLGRLVGMEEKAALKQAGSLVLLC